MKILLLDGQYSHSLSIAAELSRDLGAEIYGVASSSRSHLHRSRFIHKAVFAPLSTNCHYRERILEIIQDIRPDVIMPIGYYSFANLMDVRDRLPEGSVLASPSGEAFAVAEDKSLTYGLAKSLGVIYPRQLSILEGAATEVVEGSLRFPVFVKARVERGGQSTALVRNMDELLSLDLDTFGGSVILQEYIAAEPFTYAHAGLFAHGEPVVTFQHKELRSVPRRGGSGTRLRTFDDPDLAETAELLLKRLRWDGVAQVEFKKNDSGEYVLMEINPKFWASYALASKAGARIASSTAMYFCGGDVESCRDYRRRDMNMVFPVREAMHFLGGGDERSSAIDSMSAMLWPPARWDIVWRDLYANVPLPARSRLRGREK